MDDLIREFLTESQENLDRLDQDLVKLESEPTSVDLLSSIFRTIHTIKGTCGFLGFTKLEKVAHVGENLLSRLRDGKLVLNANIVSGLLAMVDAVRQMLGQIQATGADGDEDYSELMQTLTKLQTGESPGAPAAAQPANPAAELPSPAPDAAALVPAVELAPVETEPTPSTTALPQPEAVAAPETPALAAAEKPVTDKAAAAGKNRPVSGKIGGILVERGHIQPEDVGVALAEQEKGDRRRLGEILVAMGLARAEDVAAAQQFIESRARESEIETIRVGVNLLDDLMTLVGELVLARNQLLQYSSAIGDAQFQAISQRMNMIATELQEDVMKTRMQPIGNIWSKFPRTVRDVALNCGKDVRIEMEGKETELDKTIIEAIKDPLTHLVRNAVDHGIETPQARAKVGKHPTGVLTLRAFHEGGQVNIEISDDGAGLNVDRIRKKAVERGVITAEHATRMQDREIFNLIFLAGFSTAEKVTNVSGRGVGMDVVKTNVEKIGGTVDVQSTAGHGTTVRVKIPLTLAIIPALVVTCCGDRFAIPQVALTELVSFDVTESKGSIEMVQGAPVYRLRGRLLPLVYLNRELRLPETQHDSTVVNIVVLRADDRQFGLVVDHINDTEEIVVKPLRKQLKSVKVFAGASIMGDGRVALILDVPGLAQRANVVGQVRETAAKQDAAAASQHASQTRQTLLLFQPGAEGRMAIPLSSVARLEEFKRSAIERTGRQEVVQYRGRILPLIRVAEVVECGSGAAFETAAADAQTPLQVIVYTEQGRSVGLVVENILDIVEEQLVLEQPGRRSGVLGSALIQQRVTDLLDVEGVVRAVDPSFFEQAAGASA